MIKKVMAERTLMRPETTIAPSATDDDAVVDDDDEEGLHRAVWGVG